MSNPFGVREGADDDVLLNRYIDDEVSEEERARIEERLARDSEFRAKLADLVDLNAALEIGLAGMEIPNTGTSGDDGEHEEGEGVELVDEEMVVAESLLESNIVRILAAIVLVLGSLIMIGISIVWLAGE